MLENEMAETLSLNGTWQIEIGGAAGDIQVPAAWEAQGYPGGVGVTESVIYRRAFDVPAHWQDFKVVLRFGAVSYYAEVFVNGIPTGTHEGLWTAFECDVTQTVKFGETNQLEVRVVKPGRAGARFPYRDVLVGFLPYVFDTFGGIWQDVTLVAQRSGSFADVVVLPDADRGAVDVRWQADSGDVLATIMDAAGAIVAHARNLSTNQQSLAVEAPQYWSPGKPTLYRLILQLVRGDVIVAETTRLFGFRRLEADGNRLRFNGAPIHLRGALSWGWDPKTLAPTPTDDEVRDEFRRVREMGFNMVKLCLFVPPEHVFRIADEEGMLLWLELPLWLPNLSDHLREQARIEYAEIMARVHHHPSVVIYSLGCELGADMADAALLDALNATVRGTVRGCLVCDNSGSGEAFAGLSFDYADFNDYHFYADLHYFVPLLNLFRRDWRPARPLIFGEFCDADDYRDPATLLEDGRRPAWRDYEGIEGNVTRWAYIEQEQRMAANTLPFSDAQISAISRSQSLVVRKTILERTRLRGDIGGYVLTGLRDTPINAAGVFDDSGRAKWEPGTFRAFNNDTVLLLEQGRARRWTHGGDRPYPGDLFNHRAGAQASFRVVLAHAQREFGAGELVWRLVAPSGETQSNRIALDKTLRTSPSEIVRIEFSVPEVTRAEQWALEVELDGSIRNRWSLWFYPTLPPLEATLYDPAGALSDLGDLAAADLSRDELVIAGAFTPELESYLRAGGRAVLIQPGAGALPTQPVPFWRESIKLLYDHPVMNAMPHAGYADLQFYHVATDYAFDTAVFQDVEITPVMRRLDARLFTMLDYVVDARLGAGRMLATTLRLLGGAGDQAWGLEANVAGEYLLHQMIQALTSQPD